MNWKKSDLYRPCDKGSLLFINAFTIGLVVITLCVPSIVTMLGSSIVLLLSIGTDVLVIINHRYLKRKLKILQEKYPYLDLKIDSYDLTKALADAKVIEHKRYTGDIEFNIGEYDSNIEEYENYLKAEEIKENYFQETKYERYMINPEVSHEELERVKTKVKSLMR